MRLRRAVAGAGALVVGGFVIAAATAGAAQTQTLIVPPDHQSYVSASAVDPYGDYTTSPGTVQPDPTSIHVSMNGGKEQTRSYIHYALDYLPTGAVASKLTATFQLTDKASAPATAIFNLYNVKPEQAIVQACALTKQVSEAEPTPAYDCAHGSAIAKPNADFTLWTIELRALVEYWAAHGNTGAVLVPIASTSSDTWAVSFLTSASSSRATFTVPTVKNPVPTNQPTQGSTGNTDSGGSTGSTGGGTSGGAPLSGGTATAPGSIGSAPSVAPQPGAAPSTANQTSPASDNSRTWWPWILLGSIMLAGAAVGVAQRDKLIPLVQRIGPPSIVALRAHPRAYTVAGVALSWGLLFTGYSIVVQPQRHDNQQNAANGSSVPGVGAGGQTTGPGATTGAAAAGAGSAGGNGASGTNGSGGSGTNGGDPSLNEFSGPGVWRTISGVQVFFPAKGGPPVAKLYSGKDDTIGITSNKVNLCAHAATTYGPAFNIEASDLNVYWQWRNAHGGVYGRQVNATYKNDDYKPDKAVQAAQSCKDDKTFVLLGGIGFDQIPAVRQWAEQNHELYLHHIAVGAGSEGKRYSFTSLPTVEDMGKFFAQLAISKFRGKKLGILYRQSPNWEPAVKVFRTMVKNAGMQIVGDYAVQKDQANYTQELAQLNGKADVVLAWENALASVEMIKQAQGLRYHPTWLLFPFNLQTNTLRETADDQELYGVAAWNAYDPGYYGGGFSSYAKEIKEFEAMYRTYDPGADLSGPGGDLLFLNWEGQKSIDGMLQICGAQCTRNKIAGIMLAGYRGGAKPACPVDFSRGDHHHGGYLVNVFHAGRDPNGRINFMPIQRCTSQVG